MEKLVSIITPCYNGEKYLTNFLESISNQVYKNIEFIFINDGSTDSSEEIFLKWKASSRNNHIDIKYIFQENKGQAKAVSRGLEIFSGDYLMLADADDTLDPNNIDTKVKCLEENPRLGFVICDCDIIDSNGNKIGYYTRKRSNKEFFLDLILEKNVFFAPGIYMYRSSDLLDVLPERKIYISSGGQNWQFLLPMAFNFDFAIIRKSLMRYQVDNSSHSHNLATKEDILHRCDLHQDILINVVKSISNLESEYESIIQRKYDSRRLMIFARFEDQTNFANTWNEMSDKGLKDYIVFILVKLHIYKLCYSIIKGRN